MQDICIATQYSPKHPHNHRENFSPSILYGSSNSKIIFLGPFFFITRTGRNNSIWHNVVPHKFQRVPLHPCTGPTIPKGVVSGGYPQEWIEFVLVGRTFLKIPYRAGELYFLQFFQQGIPGLKQICSCLCECPSLEFSWACIFEGTCMIDLLLCFAGSPMSIRLISSAWWTSLMCFHKKVIHKFSFNPEIRFRGNFQEDW